MQLALIILGIFYLYLFIDIARLLKSRINKEYLRHAWKKTAIWLIVYQWVVLLIVYLAIIFEISFASGIYLLTAVQLFIGLAILLTTISNLKRIQPRVITDVAADKDLPTLTVCIPARNETEDLHECLQSLVASTYPKLEILVLDDCSQERRTSEIIRGFAQDGVRFIAGKTPPDKWLAKNYGYDQMADEANGELLLFCGVDVRFEPQTLTQLVKQQLHNKTSMISVLPKNILKPGSAIGQSLIQPSRYAWELTLPRNFVNRPPVLSTCWLISRDKLESVGSFDAISRKCVPESYFAKGAMKDKQSYLFLASDSNIGLTCVKSIAEQRSTAIRTRYPQLHRRPELVSLVSIAELTQLILPFVILPVALLGGHVILAALSALAVLFNLAAYSLIVNLTYRRFVLSGLFALPLAAIYDICLLNNSMWQYEFGKVIWKDRNICVPVMQVIPKLPKV